jgi:hypothetical protein
MPHSETERSMGWETPGIDKSATDKACRMFPQGLKHLATGSTVAPGLNL